jgi:hypothetical protein
VRRSLAVKLTLLPMLASAAAVAQPASTDEPPLQPPGETEPMLSPPGLTPTIDPGDPPCPPADDALPETDDGDYAHGIFGGHIRDRHHHHHHHHRGVFRGGFGHYFWASGG